MQTIPKTFFITSTGRSGTAFLAKLLNRSRQYHVVHEWHIPRTRFQDGHLTRFPLFRFVLARRPLGKWRKGYGEVNSYLRKVTSLTAEGPERFIERRAVILRDPRDVIASGMNRQGKTKQDFELLCNMAIQAYARVIQLLNHPTLHYDSFEFDRMTTDLAYLQSLIDWTGITDLQVTADELEHKVNTSPSTWFPRWASWDDSERATYLRIKQQRVGGNGVDLKWTTKPIEAS